MPIVGKTFRIGRVKVYPRGRVWYVCYFENNQRRRPRVTAIRNQAAKAPGYWIVLSYGFGRPAWTDCGP